MRFEASASLRRCSGAGGFVLEGELRGNGVLVWLRGQGGDSLPRGRYAVLSRGDTLTPRGAVVAVRFMTGDSAHGLVLDSGAVTVSAEQARGSGVSVTVRGAGLESAEGRRVGVEAEFAKTRLAADGARCQTQL